MIHAVQLLWMLPLVMLIGYVLGALMATRRDEDE